MNYSIKDTTLTALGDAIRNKTDKYLHLDEPTSDCFYEVDFDTSQIEPYSYKSSGILHYRFEMPIDLQTLLGEKYEATESLWVEYSWEFSDKPTSSMTLYGVGITRQPVSGYNPNNSYNGGIHVYAYEDGLAGSGTNYYKYFNNEDFITVVYCNVKADFYDEKHPVCKFRAKLWACDADGRFIELSTYTPLEMVEKINGLMTIPDSALNITGECNYRFSSNGWNWFIKQYGDKITTNNITATTYMFYNSNELEYIPFEINMDNSTDRAMNYTFQACAKLKELPKINNAYPSNLQYFASGCNYVREIPEDYFDTWKWDRIRTSSLGRLGNMFQGMYSLRKVPVNLLKELWNTATSGSSVYYYYAFQYCYTLDEIVGLAVSPGKLTSNVFNNTFASCYRLKDMIFQTNEDGTPIVAPWKSQTIDLSSSGFVDTSYNTSYITGYNTGITADKQVKDDATYQALKNDPDWYTVGATYSRYNHDSAVNTINSLPDCSATGTNTIKFRGAAGALTDGGAINTLTEEEIAVATAKGWVVSYV